MSYDEEIILAKICKDKGINPKILKNIFIIEENHYYSNESRQNVVVEEIIKSLKYWLDSEKGETK